MTHHEIYFIQNNNLISKNCNALMRYKNTVQSIQCDVCYCVSAIQLYRVSVTLCVIVSSVTLCVTVWQCLSVLLCGNDSLCYCVAMTLCVTVWQCLSVLLCGNASLCYCVAMPLCVTVWQCLSVLLCGNASLCYCVAMPLCVTVWQ